MSIDTTKPGWYVVCEHFTAGPYKTKDAAERRLTGIVKLGACGGNHRIEERV